jgi:DNA-binding transcriptional ArsR family regulator
VSEEKSVSIEWEFGTAYDFFFSLHVLNSPEDFSLRGSWAAGVRSRLSPVDRNILEDAQEVVPFPFVWIYHLPQPKDGETALMELTKLPPSQRLPALTFASPPKPELRELLENVASRRSWDEKDMDKLKGLVKGLYRRPKKPACILDCWAHPDEFGERYLIALRAYQDSFFIEEEQRIQPMLKEAIKQAQQRATQVSWTVLLEELSQGVSFASLHDIEELTLAPSYWSTPLIVYERVTPEKALVLFGARSSEISLVPGEFVQDAMLRALKALADPTRLRILRHLSEQAHTPTQLARLVRLRAPTIIHHLNALRLAGLVKLTLEDQGERRYAVRRETIKSTFEALMKFLGEED